MGKHVRPLAYAERGGRLVEDHNLCLALERASDSDGLPLASREPQEPSLWVDPSDPDTFKLGRSEFAGAFIVADWSESEHALRRAVSEYEVVRDAEIRTEREILIDGFDSRRACLGWVSKRDLTPKNSMVPRPAGGLRPIAPQDDSSGSVVANEAYYFASSNRETGVSDRYDRPESLREPDIGAPAASSQVRLEHRG